MASRLSLEMCSDINPEQNTCKLRHLHYNETTFQFNTFYGSQTTKLRLFNSTLPKLGKYGLCKSNYPNLPENKIEEIDLSGVQLQEMAPDTFESCSKLKILILRSNKIETLEEVFSYNSELEKLDLTNNLIKEIRDETFVPLTKLKVLLLSNNFLTRFAPILIESCHRLEVLKLDSNDLFDLNVQKMVEYVPNMKTLAFNNNQLRCQHVKEIQEFLSTKKVWIEKAYEGMARERIEPTVSYEMIICFDNRSWVTVHYIFAYTKIMEGN